MSCVFAVERVGVLRMPGDGIMDRIDAWERIADEMYMTFSQTRRLWKDLTLHVAFGQPLPLSPEMIATVRGMMDERRSLISRPCE